MSAVAAGMLTAALLPVEGLSTVALGTAGLDYLGNNWAVEWEVVE